jgi:hypothetical protein
MPVSTLLEFTFTRRPWFSPFHKSQGIPETPDQPFCPQQEQDTQDGSVTRHMLQIVSWNVIFKKGQVQIILQTDMSLKTVGVMKGLKGALSTQWVSGSGTEGLLDAGHDPGDNGEGKEARRRAPGRGDM